MQGPLILDRYRPIEVKGEGGSGKVELCWDTRIQRRVAIKRMPISNARKDGTIPGLAEARTGAMLSRPSIVSVYDFDVTDSEALLIMEAIEGPTLSDLIDGTPAGTFDLDIAAAIITAVGDAISFAHENQVLHLDIKPDNILITRTGACKVSDFGVSELANAHGFGKASGGTIGYMPPEQMNRKKLDERCDEFALAAVAYEILTGRRPFAAKTIDASLKRINKFDIAAPSLTRGDIDPGIDNVFYAALAPDRNQRYDSVDEFLDALLPYLGNAAQGAMRLKEIAADDDFYEEEPEYVEKPPLRERITPTMLTVAGRAIAALLCWWVSSSALVNLPFIPAGASLLIALLPALAAAIKPPLGGFLALVINGAVLFTGEPLSIGLGVVSIAAAIAWLIFFGFEGMADTNCALVIAPLRFIGFTPFAPMIAGYCLPPLRTCGAVLIQAVLLLTSGKNTGPELLFGSITSVSTWIIIVCWLISAVCMSLLCSRESRVLSICGAIAAACVLLVGQSIAAWTMTGMLALPNATWTITTIISCVVMCVICAINAPVRHKGE